MREDALEFGDPDVSLYMKAKNELKVEGAVAEYSSSDLVKVDILISVSMNIETGRSIIIKNERMPLRNLGQYRKLST